MTTLYVNFPSLHFFLSHQHPTISTKPVKLPSEEALTPSPQVGYESYQLKFSMVRVNMSFQWCVTDEGLVEVQGTRAATGDYPVLFK